MRCRTTGSSRKGNASALGRVHVIDEQVEALLDRREREQGEALEIERLRDVLESVVHLADDVLVGHEHVLDEALDGHTGLVERHEHER